MMARRTYTRDQKHAALVALMVSAHDDDGQWCPMFRSVSRSVEVPEATLRRWWRARDKAGDGALRRKASRIRKDVADAGAKKWLEDRVADIREGITWIVSSEHRETKPIVDGRGEVVGEDLKCQPHHLARAYRDAAELVTITNAMLTTGGSKDTHTRIQNLRRSVQRVGLARQQASKAAK